VILSHMGSGRFAASHVAVRQRWLGLSFLGIWVYLAAQLSQLYPTSFADGVGLSATDADLVLRIMSNLGQVFFFAGIVATLSRANRRAGVSRAGIRGLVAGSAGIGVLALIESFLLLQWFEVPLSSLAQVAEYYQVVSVLGVGLALAGIASLAVGLNRSAMPPERATDTLAAAPSVREKPV